MSYSVEVYKRASVLYRLKQYDKAQKCLEEASDWNSRSLSLYAFCLQRNSRFKEAVHAAKQATMMNPSDSYAWSTLAWCLDTLEKHKEALQIALIAVETDPTDADNYSALARSYYGCNQYQQAIEVAEDGLELEPDNTYCMYWLAMALKDSGRPGEAIEVFNQSLEIDPLDPFVYQWLSDIYLLLRDFEQSREHALTGIRLDPTNVELRNKLWYIPLAKTRFGLQYLRVFKYYRLQPIILKICFLPVFLPIAFWCAFQCTKVDEEIRQANLGNA